MQVIETPDRDFWPWNITFSPNGRWLGLYRSGQVCVIDTASGIIRGVYGNLGGGGNNGFGFTADSLAIIFATVRENHGGRITRVYDIESNKILRWHSASIVSVGRSGFVYLYYNDGIFRWDSLTDETYPFLGTAALADSFAISGDERWAATFGYGNVIRVWDLSGTQMPTRATRRFLATGAGLNGIMCVVFSGSGEFLAYQGRGLDFCVANVRTRSVWRFSERFYITSKQAAFHPSQPILACCLRGGEVVSYNVASQTEVKRYDWGLDSADVIAFSPDGLRCAVANKQKVVIWDTDD